MSKFLGVLANTLYAEEGVNIVVKGLEDEKIILAPTGPTYDFEKEPGSNTLAFTLTPSSGTTENRNVKLEVKNGTEKTTDSATHWEIQITSSSDPTEFELAVEEVEEEIEEGGVA